MKYTNIVVALVLGTSLLALLAPAASAHERETFVSWEVANQFINYLAPPVITVGTVDQQGPFVATGPVVVADTATATDQSRGLNLRTGQVLLITYSFLYKGGDERRGDLFWVTRLGLDFGTLGRYITQAPPLGDGLRHFIGANSFALKPNGVYVADLVIRSLRPTLRHLHVGVSIKDVGNIPAAPIDPANPAQAPILYGVWTNASGSVVEPLQGVTVPGWGALTLLGTWWWASAAAAGQFLLGGGFLAFMYWYGKRQAKKAAGGGA